jgi:hypothetical protein
MTGLPATVTNSSNQAAMYPLSDGNLYISAQVGAYPSITNHAYQISESCVIANGGNASTCTHDLTTSTISASGVAGARLFGIMPNGTILFEATNFSPLGETFIWAWNGSTSSPSWSLITGFTITSAGDGTFNFSNDSLGYTWFGTFFNGDIWRNDAPNSLNFTKILNVYGTTNGGGAGHIGTGGIDSVLIAVINGVENICAGGEGEWDCFVRSTITTSPTWTAYLTTAGGYGGNIFGADKSATHPLVMRGGDVAGDTVNQLNLSTGVMTLITVASGGYPAFAISSPGSAIQFMNGTTWAMADHNSTLGNFIYYTTNDGSNWSAMPAGYCPSAVLGNASGGNKVSASAHYFYTQCYNSSTPAVGFSYYGPM